MGRGVYGAQAQVGVIEMHSQASRDTAAMIQILRSVPGVSALAPACHLFLERTVMSSTCRTFRSGCWLQSSATSSVLGLFARCIARLFEATSIFPAVDRFKSGQRARAQEWHPLPRPPASTQFLIGISRLSRRTGYRLRLGNSVAQLLRVRERRSSLSGCGIKARS